MVDCSKLFLGCGLIFLLGKHQVQTNNGSSSVDQKVQRWGITEVQPQREKNKMTPLLSQT